MMVFGTIRARDRHERTCCSSRGATKPTSYETSYEVPSHEHLGLDRLQCRFPDCNKRYKTVVTRIRHERDSHRFMENGERTLSPHPFPSFSLRSPLQESVKSSLFRPQSGPPSLFVETPPTESSGVPKECQFCHFQSQTKDT